MIVLDVDIMGCCKLFKGFFGLNCFFRGVTWSDVDEGEIRVVVYKDSGNVLSFFCKPSSDLSKEPRG